MTNELFKKSFDNIPIENEVFVRLYVQILKRVNYILEQKGYKQKDLAESLGKKESEISKWLSGEHNLTLKSLAKLQAALGEEIITVVPTPSLNEKIWKKVQGSQFCIYTENQKLKSDPAFEEVNSEIDNLEIEIA